MERQMKETEMRHLALPDGRDDDCSAGGGIRRLLLVVCRWSVVQVDSGEHRRRRHRLSGAATCLLLGLT